MAFDLDITLAPAHTAFLLVDLQRGLVGDIGSNQLVRTVMDERAMLSKLIRLVEAARSSGVRVVHCVAEMRVDHAGARTNAPVLASASRKGSPVYIGSAGAQIIPELGPEREDFIISRISSLSPFMGTSLDPILRSLNISTVVIAGVSVNIGVVGACIEAVNLGYNVVVPSDGVAGYPGDYADAVLNHTIALIGSVTTSLFIEEVWRR